MDIATRPPNTPIARAVVTVEEFAQEFGYSKNHAWKLVNTGEIPAIRKGRTVRISRLVLDKLLTAE